MQLVPNGINMSNISRAIEWFLILFVAWYVTSAIWTWYRLRHIPGPWLASFSYLWIALTTVLGRTGEAYTGLKKYGSLVRNGPNYLVTDDPDVLRRISGVRSRYTKDRWYTAAKFSVDVNSVSNILDMDHHDKLKAKLLAGYSSRENPDLEVAIDSQVIRLLDLIRRKHLSTEGDFRAVDLSPISRYFTMDVITRLTCGDSLGHLDEGEDVHGWVAQVDKMIVTMSVAMDLPLVRRLVYSSFGLGLFGPKPTDKAGVGKVIGIIQRVVKERFAKDVESKNDMFGNFIRRGISPKELEGEAMLAFAAGSDTAASAIRAILLYTTATPRVYQRLKAEIRQAVAEQEASSPISLAQALRLPYLQAVIWEGYRMKPPVNYGHYKVVPPEGDTINGLFVPGGTAIGYNQLALARNERVYGSDVDLFRPERFLQCSEAKRSEMERAIDVTFGGGRSMCAGKTIAAMEMNKVVFELLRAFDIQLIYPGEPWKETHSFIKSQHDMWVRITDAVES